jgi:hypothetical protein
VAHLGERRAHSGAQAGDNTFEASKMNIKENSPELYMRFLGLILRLGRRAPGLPLPRLTAAFALIKSPNCATGITSHLKDGGVPENAGSDTPICNRSVGAFYA